MRTIFCIKAIIKDKTDVVDGALQQQVGTIAIVLLLAKISKKQIHLKSGTRAVLQADSELTLKVGGHFIKIDAAGVHVVDSAINLTPFFSPGGSPGTGVGFSGELAKRPLGTESPQYDTDLTAAQGNQAPDAPLAGINAASTTDSTDAAAEKESAAAAEDTTTSLSEPILQSALLKASASLEQLANNAGSSYQKGSTLVMIKHSHNKAFKSDSATRR